MKITAFRRARIEVTTHAHRWTGPRPITSEHATNHPISFKYATGLTNQYPTDRHRGLPLRVAISGVAVFVSGGGGGGCPRPGHPLPPEQLPFRRCLWRPSCLTVTERNQTEPDGTNSVVTPGRTAPDTGTRAHSRSADITGTRPPPHTTGRGGGEHHILPLQSAARAPTPTCPLPSDPPPPSLDAPGATCVAGRAESTPERRARAH